MNTDTAEKEVGIGGETQEPENSKNPETTYDFNESKADGDPEPVGDQQNQDRQDGYQVDDAVNIHQLAQPIPGTIQSGSIFHDEKKNDNHLDFPQNTPDCAAFHICFSNINAANEQIQEDDDDVDCFAGRCFAVDEIKADGFSEGSVCDDLASGYPVAGYELQVAGSGLRVGSWQSVKCLLFR